MKDFSKTTTANASGWALLCCGEQGPNLYELPSLKLMVTNGLLMVQKSGKKTTQDL